MILRRRGALAVAVAVLLGACSTSTAGRGSPQAVGSTGSPSRPAAPSSQPTSPAPAVPVACPAAYISPDPMRPRVVLEFTVVPDKRTVTGTEHVAFTPDRDITELVFRLTANTVPTVAQGNRITVQSASADHGAGVATYTASGADPTTQGGLLHIPFAARVAAGTTVSADIAFTLTLGPGAFDRFGRASDFAWFGSGQPLLAWERGYGWHTEPLIQFTAESATSEAMQTDLTVTAAATDVVVMSGDPTAPSPGPGGRKVWHASIDAARDVSVAVGPFKVEDLTVGQTKLRVAGIDDTQRNQLVPSFRRALTELPKLLGPFPYPTLSVAGLPSDGGGIEYPSSILMLSLGDLVAVHETAHQWFYAMVGNSQAQHAWLDEAFASFAEQVVDGTAHTQELRQGGPVDKPTASYGGDEGNYYSITYDKGSAALHEARQTVGPAKFDAALRCYLNANAWRIANPADFAAALKDLPGALAVLKTAGAL